MYCPVCGSEYVDGIERCRSCDTVLVAGPPSTKAVDAHDPVELVAVFSSAHEEPIAVAQSILRSAEVPFFVRGETIKDLFGYGRFPLGHSVTLGPMQIVVDANDAQDARELLQGVDSPETADATFPPVGQETRTARNRWLFAARLFAGLVLIYLLGPLIAILVGMWFD